MFRSCVAGILSHPLVLYSPFHGQRYWAVLAFEFLGCVVLFLSLSRSMRKLPASIKGAVTDASGAGVPAASVRVKNLETGATAKHEHRQCRTISGGGAASR